MHVTKYTSALKFYREYSSAASAKIDIRQALQIQRSTPAKIPFKTLSHEDGFLRSVTTHTEGPTDVFFLLLFPIPSPLVWTNTFFNKECFFFHHSTIHNCVPGASQTSGSVRLSKNNNSWGQNCLQQCWVCLFGFPLAKSVFHLPPSHKGTATEGTSATNDSRNNVSSEEVVASLPSLGSEWQTNIQYHEMRRLPILNTLLLIVMQGRPTHGRANESDAVIDWEYPHMNTFELNRLITATLQRRHFVKPSQSHNFCARHFFGNF